MFFSLIIIWREKFNMPTNPRKNKWWNTWKLPIDMICYNMLYMNFQICIGCMYFSNMCWILVEIFFASRNYNFNWGMGKIFAQGIHETNILKEFFGLKKTYWIMFFYSHTQTQTPQETQILLLSTPFLSHFSNYFHCSHDVCSHFPLFILF